jgi:putative addiction module killer protein
MDSLFQLDYYQTIEGKSPFVDWFTRLKDGRAKALIAARLARIEGGNLGDSKSVGNGVSELRIAYGPGYRIYYAQQVQTFILLLCGGSKGTQKRDIEKAQQYLQDYTLRG